MRWAGGGRISRNLWCGDLLAGKGEFSRAGIDPFMVRGRGYTALNTEKKKGTGGDSGSPKGHRGRERTV